MTTSESIQIAVKESDADVRPLIPADKIAERVRELAKEISSDYAGKSIVAVGVLHGAYVFMADLIRQLTIPVRSAFIMARSYGDNMETTGRIELELDVTESIDGAHVLLIDDIVDTGLSTDWLIKHLNKKHPANLRVCALLNKAARRQTSVAVDYVGFDIPDRFVVGYGIDYAGRYRELPFIGYVDAQEQT